jgi:alpha-maltose-1-phosphate synthase
MTNNKVKIVYISLATSPGMQRYTNSIFFESTKTAESFLITSKFYEYDEHNTYKIISMKKPSINKEFFYVAELYNIIKKVKQIKPDIVHFLSDHPWNYFLSLFLKNYKIIYTLHDPKPHPNEKISIFKEINNSLIFSNKNISLLMHGMSDINYLLHDKKITSDRIKYAKLATEKPSENYSAIREYSTFLFFGRIRPYKGLENFINSFEEVIKYNPGAKAIIAGEGNMEPYLPLIKNYEHYEILNYEIPENEIEGLFLRSSVVVLPYNSATQSGITSLSYYYSRPVIAHNVGSLSEYVIDGESGYLVKPTQDNQELIKQMIYIISDSNKLDELSIESFNFLNNELSVIKMIRDFFDIYKTL